MVITIIGIGLIGGSVALALKKNGFAHHIIGVDTSVENANKALELNIIDEIKSLEEASLISDIVILSIPVKNALEVSKKVLNSFSSQKDTVLTDNQVLIDMGSTKFEICNHLKNHPSRKQFVATHPIAGTENSGSSAAFPTLMIDKIAIICNQQDSSPTALKRTEDLLKSMFMQLDYMDATDHDKHIAYVSHLSHITSFALGLTVLNEEKNEKNIFNMAGSGFDSTARLAKSSSEMWQPIFEQNKHNIINALDAYSDTLNHFKKAIENNDISTLTKMMNEANNIRKILDSKFKK